MPLVEVKSRPGRVCFTKPTGGVLIPSDRFVSVQLTPWITSLAEKHGDIEFRQTNSEPTAVSIEYPTTTVEPAVLEIDPDNGLDHKPSGKSRRQRAG